MAFFFFPPLLYSCLALNDLIRGRHADDFIEHVTEIWETLFRVLDDIKVSRLTRSCCILKLAFVCVYVCVRVQLVNFKLRMFCFITSVKCLIPLLESSVFVYFRNQSEKQQI